MTITLDWGKQSGKSDLSILQIITNLDFQGKSENSHHHEPISQFQQKSVQYSS